MKSVPETLSVRLVEEAYARLKGVVSLTPLQLNARLSRKYGATVYLKREDLQLVRSYKIRGAYNRMALLDAGERGRGVVAASAGNHAQGVAFACGELRVRADIYMPKNTPKQKVEQVRVLGGEWIAVHLVGDTFDESYALAKAHAEKESRTFIHPFDDVFVAAGQGTVGLEIAEQLGGPLDFVVVPVGGGGLVAGLGTYLKAKYPAVRVIGVEPEGAPSMSASLKAGCVVTLPRIDKFVDGAAVAAVGKVSFDAAKSLIDIMTVVSEGKVCEEMVRLYQSDGIITEPAGALSVAALDAVADAIRGKTVICVVSGGNNDISRYPEIMDRALIYKGLKHYFIVDFPQRPNALRDYLDKVLGPNDDITLFEYIKKSNKETGPALIGIELGDKKDLEPLLRRMGEAGFGYEALEKDSVLYRFLI